MQSLKELFRIGVGPSSSHTMGVEYAAREFLRRHPGAEKFGVTLYGSLALTGKGHGTDNVLKRVLDNAEISFDTVTQDIAHPNTLDITAHMKGTDVTVAERYYSIGGGAIRREGDSPAKTDTVYQLSSFNDIKEYCTQKGIRLSDYVREAEPEVYGQYLPEVWDRMKTAVEQGLSAEGILPGGLEVVRKAKHLYRSNHIDESKETLENRLVCAYAFAVAEQNASGGTVVTAPTCGASGVLPAVLYYMQKKHNLKDAKMVRALATGGLIGNLIKTNASISGAECGCQAEIGSACSMAAAALTELFDMDIEQTEYAAEVALEHHLGLTCDPIYGLVQVPCIERNAVAAMRAINALSLANFLTSTRKISFDLIVETMYQTGKDMPHMYRETSEGGLAKLYVLRDTANKK